MSLYGLKCAIARSVGWTLAIAAAWIVGALWLAAQVWKAWREETDEELDGRRTE